MKMKSFIAFASVAVALTACSSNEEVFVNSNFPEDGVIRVATNVDAPLTRAGVDNNNISSFYMDVKNDSSATYSYFVQMKKESSAWNSFEGENAKQMLWQNNTTPIKVTAAYLKDHAFTQEELQCSVDLSVAADQSATEAVEANDLVGMAQTTINPATNDENLVDGKIKVTLGHALTKLNVKVTLGTEYNAETDGTTTNPITAITIDGTKLKYTYTGTTAGVTLQASENDAAKVTPSTGVYTAGEGAATNAVANYECILVPQTVEANGFSVTMVINGKTYNWTSTASVTLEQGKAYTLELTAGKEILTVQSISATAWGNENANDIATE